MQMNYEEGTTVIFMEILYG